MDISPPQSDSSALLECVSLEDGVPALFEAAEAEGGGLRGVRAQLTAIQLVLADLAEAATVTPEEVSDAESPDVLLTLAEQANTVMNQVSAVRAAVVARFARWGPESDRVDARTRAHPLGHCDEWAADTLAPRLHLGTYEAQSLVQESAWMVTRTPRLLADTGRGTANLATVAAIARELQDARPDSCEQVEDTARRRGLHRRPRSAARRSTRVLVTAVETAAARRTAQRTLAQQTGVWLDPHPTPGLSVLSAALPTAEAEALMSAVDDAAHRSSASASASDERTMGEHRAEAFVGMALRHVRLTAHLEYVAPPEATSSNSVAPVLLSRTGAVDAAAVHAMLATHGGQVTASVIAADDLANSDTTSTAGATSDAGAHRYRPTAALRAPVQRRDGTCRFPGCTRAARYTDLDHVVPWPQGRTEHTNLQCLCRRHHRAKHARWAVRMDASGTCTWTDAGGRVTLTRPSRWEDLADLAALRGPPHRRPGRPLSPPQLVPEPNPAVPG